MKNIVTQLAEGLDPKEVTGLLNQHFSYVEDSILSQNGILDKYLGDAAIGLFGVPFVEDNDGYNAILAALKIKDSLDMVNVKNRILRLPPLKLGIGIATGAVVVGLVGSPKRSEYSIVGDSMNTSRHLQMANKIYGTSILICEKTHAQVKEQFHLREIDFISTREDDMPRRIYEVIGKVDLNVDLPTDTVVSL